MIFNGHTGWRLSLAAVLTVASLHAADVSVSAELSRPDITAGTMAELQLKVTGAQTADVPKEIDVEGLQIRLTGQSTQVQMVNFKVSSSVVYSYIVMPLRTGDFTIPAIGVQADGRRFVTSALPFSVRAGSAASSAASAPVPQPMLPQMPPGMRPRQALRPAPQVPSANRLAFGEIHCAKKSIYVGEMVPVEIQFFFDAHYPVQVRGKVDFGGEGVLAERFPDPKESHEERDGVTYNVLTFHTLLSAVKPGSVDLAPAKLDSQMQIPGGAPPGFDDPVFQQLLGGQSPFTQSRDLAVKTAPLHLDIMPLPKEKRPDSFGGAVGQFDIDAVVANPHPAPGDPATLLIKIGGKGNFKAMGPPVLTNAEGWRTYPPTDKFDSSDELSYTGVKSFDYTLIAQQDRQLSPGAEFSYFDPVAQQYVTLTTKPLPLVSTPGSTAVPPPSGGVAPASAQGSPLPKQSTGPAKEGDPLGEITLRSWTTPVQRPEFLIASLAMIVATVALAGILYLRDLQARGGSDRSRRRRRIATLWSVINADTSDAISVYDAAVEYAGMMDVPESARDAVTGPLREQRDKLKYGTGGSFPLPPAERESLLATLRGLSPGKTGGSIS